MWGCYRTRHAAEYGSGVAPRGDGSVSADAGAGANMMAAQVGVLGGQRVFGNLQSSAGTSSCVQP
jgi:hypothetical protein